MDLIGRKREILSLNHHLASSESKLIALYGRRRVGKTYLVREHLKNQIIFDVAGLHHGQLSDQIGHFTNAMISRGYTQAAIQQPTSWMATFQLLQNYIDSLKGKKKKVVFIDELPWLDTPRSKFLMAFESFWNEYCTKRKDLLVIICGSAASWMIKKILKNKGGLHNRISESIRLQPFNLHETQAFLKAKGIKWSHYDITQLYMVTGGVPYYLDGIRKGESTHQFINRTCFSTNGFLYREFEQLFQSLFERSDHHYTIAELLSSKKQGLTRNEISNLTGISSGGTLTNVLDELKESGFIQEVVPYTGKKTKALYKLVDHFVLFYHKFIKPSSPSHMPQWLLLKNKQSWISWSGLAFERICQQHIYQIKRALRIDAIASRTSTYANDQAQIDLLIDRDDNVINLCEIKFYNAPFTIDKAYAQKLRIKQSALQSLPGAKRKNIFLTMVTTFGSIKNQYYQELVQNEVVLEDLFEKDINS